MFIAINASIIEGQDDSIRYSQGPSRKLKFALKAIKMVMIS